MKRSASTAAERAALASREYLDEEILLDECLRYTRDFARGLFKKGDSLRYILLEDVHLPITSCTLVKVKVGEELLCAAIYPKKSGDGGVYSCRMVDSALAIQALMKTEALNKLAIMRYYVESGFSNIWRYMQVVDGSVTGRSPEVVIPLKSLHSSIQVLNSVLANYIEYFDVTEHKCILETVDAGEFASSVVNECNRHLKSCGRYIALKCGESAFVRINPRHAVAALVNALHNALLYSPKDSVPVLELSLISREDKRFVTLTLENEAADTREPCPNTRGFGLGVPIIQRFTEESEGSCSLDEKDGRYILTITLPAETHCSSFADWDYFDIDIKTPDILQLKMADIARHFACDNTDTRGVIRNV